MRKTVAILTIIVFLAMTLFYIDCVINGDSASLDEFPSTVRLVVYNSENNVSQPRCTGVILNEILILTAGHCLDRIHNLSSLEVIAGDYHRTTIEDTEQRRQVVTKYPHPLMDYEHARRYDLTILRLDTPLIFGESVLPTTLPERDYDSKDGELTFSGWGIDTRPGEQLQFPDILQKLILEIIDTKTCEQIYRFHSEGNEDFSGALCGFNVLDNATPCAADSGGGAFYVNGSEKVLAGILSYTLDCNRTAPAVFTRINQEIVLWINTIVNDTWQYSNVQDYLNKTESNDNKPNKSSMYTKLNVAIKAIAILTIAISCIVVVVYFVYCMSKHLCCTHRNTNNVDVENKQNSTEEDKLITPGYSNSSLSSSYDVMET